MLKQSKIYLFIFKCFSISALEYVEIETSTNEIKEEIEKMQCISNIINVNIPCGTQITTVLTTDSLDNNVLKAINSNNCYSLITRSRYKQNWLVQNDVYLILIQDASELPTTLFELSRDLKWNPNAKFILTVLNSMLHDIHKIFNEFLKHRIYNVVLATSMDSDNIQLSTYFPFNNSNCGTKFDGIVTLGECSNISINSDKVIFHENIYDYRQCSIVVGIHEVVPYVTTNETTELTVEEEYKFGIEQVILEYIAAIEGINFEYVVFPEYINRGVVLSNNSGTGMLSYLQSGEISLVVGGFILILNRALIFDYIWGYNYADLKIVTPAATEVVWKKLYREFGIQTWVLIVISFFVMSTITLLILKIPPQRRQDSMNIMLKLLDYLLEHSDDGIFKNRYLRLLLICWVWYTYFITSFYKTAYYSLITGHVKEKSDFEPTNLKLLPYEPCISDDGRSFFLYAYNLTFPYGKKIEECQTPDGSLDYVAEHRDYYTVSTEYAYFLQAPKYIDQEGNFKLDSWDILSSTISTFYCTRGFKLRKKFQTHAMHIFESGLLLNRLNMMNVKSKHFTQNNKKYFKRLQFGDFRISYCILIVGFITSGLCFLFERFYYKVTTITK